MVLCPGTPDGSTGSGSGLKRLRRRGNGLKSHPTDWEKPGIEPMTLGLLALHISYLSIPPGVAYYLSISELALYTSKAVSLVNML